MGERKGQNHYYPPDFDYKKHKNLNKYHGTHALRERATKLKDGILIIRFEMPFNVWCLGCNNHVGMGVRYNAEKKRCGMYYTTPLFEFRMKCHLCDNYFVIRTDPKNFDYELVEGLRRQERRFDPSDVDNLGAVDRNFQQKLAGDAMFKAEHQKDDKAKATENEDQIGKLERIKKRDRDAYGMNCELRRQFRFQKKLLGEKRAADDALKQKLSLNDLELLPSTSEDRRMAQHILTLKDVKSHGERQEEMRDRISKESIFSRAPQKRGIVSSIKLHSNVKNRQDVDIGGLIVKRTKGPSTAMTKAHEVEEQDEPVTNTTSKTQIGLVDYASDSSSDS